MQRISIQMSKHHKKSASPFSGLLHNLATLSHKILTHQPDSPARGVANMVRLGWTYRHALTKTLVSALKQPEVLIQHQLQLAQQHWQLLQTVITTSSMSVKKSMTSHDDDQYPENQSYQYHPDRRFQHKTWQSPFYYWLHQAYLLNAQALEKILAQITIDDRMAHQQAKFVCHNLLAMLAPSNCLLTNPEALQQAYQTRGKSLINGLYQLTSDVLRWQGYVNLTKTPIQRFVYGENIAPTPGKVVFRNQLIELIQYQPSTQQAYAIPLLFVTSWINKYYLLDLNARSSLVKWAVAQGYTVFIISWVNPDQRYRHYTMNDYVQHGTLAALNAITQRLPVNTVNVAGHCLGGTLLAMTAAYLAKQPQHYAIKSITLLATLLDFSDAGPLSYFMQEPQIRLFEDTMQASGLWAGHKMVTAFNLARPDENIWPFWVRQYLLGKEPPLHDMLYWAIDLTNTPAEVYRFYMRQLQLCNKLVEANSIRVLDQPISLSDIEQPCYVLGLKQDQISPWQGCYLSSQYLTSNVQFVLATGGHFSGIQYPNRRQQLTIQTHTNDVSDTRAWLQQAKTITRHWQSHWHNWLKNYAGNQTATCVLPDDLTDAPGEYIVSTHA
ncbi:MAG: class I poly(R)-hydroxyalkanoic acid synthase [Gammaproteobacteria bacterium]